MYSEAQNKASQKYKAKNLERLTVWLPKGKKQSYKDHASSQGKSLSKWITDTLDENMKESQE